MHYYSRLLGVIVIALIIGAVYLVHYLMIPRYSKVITQTKPVAFQTTNNDDCSLAKGTDQVVTKGSNGVETITYKVSYANGKKVSQKVLSDKTTAKPVAQVTNIGSNDPNASQYPDLPGQSPNPCAGYDALNCDLNDLSPLLAGAGGKVTQQEYDNYVQYMKQNDCGTPTQYCLLDASVPCSGISTGASTDSGYDAGYNYAEQYQICDPNYDNGDSQDFNDGVNAWTADNCTDGQPN